MRSHLTYVSATVAVVLSIASCANPLSSTTPETQVAKRAAMRWDSLRAKNFSAAYTFLSPANRASTTREAYVNALGDGGSWLAADVVAVTCEQQLCEAKVRIEVAPPVPGKFGDRITTHVDENWVFVDGQWWFNQK